MHTNLFNIVLLAFFLSLGTAKMHAQETRTQKLDVPPIQKTDNKVVVVNLKTVQDSIKKDSLKPQKAFLDGKIKYKAEDYTTIDQKKKLLTLYNKAELYYKDIELTAGKIVMNYENDEIYAGRIKDSTGKLTQNPVFKQGANVVTPDSIRFNFKTKKALVFNSRTNQGDFNIKAAVTKKESDSVYYMKNAIFTTAKDIDNPEYYFRTNKVKLVPGKKVVVGFTNMVIADVPTPIALPFAFFPMSETSASGILIPSYGDSQERGFSLQNLGYYFALGDHYDLAVLGDYYTNGSYGLRAESNYAKRYAFSGTFNVRYENLITSERGFPDYAKGKIYNIQWSHMKDAKSNPSSRFTASVNLGSSKYFQQSINQVNVGSTLNNTLNSAVSYSKTFNSVPQVNMSLTATHQQNTQTESIDMTLPTLQVSVDRIFPFAPKDGIKRGFIKNINFQYSANAKNSISTNDSLFFTSQMFKDANVGMQHNIPISTNFKILKYISATSSFNYQETWTLNTVNKYFDPYENEVVTERINGFDSFRTYSLSQNFGTTIYGTFNFGADKNIQSIRHVMRPSVSYSYVPSYERYYEEYDYDGTGTIFRQFTRFDGGIYGAPGNNMSSLVGFNLTNKFEAKVKDKDETKTAPKKIVLLNSLNISGSYNIAADTLAWSPLRISGGTTILNDKMQINFGATLDPYAIDNAGRKINTFNADNGGSLFRMTSANVSMGYSLSSRDNPKDKKDKNKQGFRNGGRADDLFGTNTDLSDRRESQFDESDEESKFSGFFNADLPWDFTVAYSLTYGNARRENSIVGNSIMVSANADLTPKWKVGVSTGYDFVQQGVTFTQFRFERDLLSWRMDFNWSPFGDNAFWGFFIGIKSGVLSDIKWEKRTQPNRILR
ncbi:MAG: putative LPS assembly protein LptD [Flavobacterium sp.]